MATTAVLSTNVNGVENGTSGVTKWVKMIIMQTNNQWNKKKITALNYNKYASETLDAKIKGRN